ncbi:hypothetical protein D3C85_1313730 [compost metagenome]
MRAGSARRSPVKSCKPTSPLLKKGMPDLAALLLHSIKRIPRGQRLHAQNSQPLSQPYHSLSSLHRPQAHPAGTAPRRTKQTTPKPALPLTQSLHIPQAHPAGQRLQVRSCTPSKHSPTTHLVPCSNPSVSRRDSASQHARTHNPMQLHH